MSIGGSKNSGKTTSTSNSSTQGEGYDYGTDLWSGQSPYLKNLYAGAQQMLNQAGGFGGQYFSQAASADSAASNALAAQDRRLQLAGTGIGQSEAQLRGATTGLNRGLNTLNESNLALRKFLNPGVDPALAAYSKNLGQQFNEQFLPGLKGDAAVAGGLGGSRAQIGAALGSQRAQQSLSEFAANAYSGQQERALQAATQIGNLNQGYAQNAAGFQQNASGYLNNSSQWANIGQGYAQNAQGYQGLSQNRQGLYDLARQMPWYNLNQYSGLLGMPITLDQGGFNWNNSSTTSSSSGKSSGGGFNFGLK